MTPTIDQDVQGSDGRAGLHLRCGYDEKMVDMLKDKIIPRDRCWRDEVSAWWIAAQHLELVKKIVLKRFGSVQVIGRAGEEDMLFSRDGVLAAQGRLL